MFCYMSTLVLPPGVARQNSLLFYPGVRSTSTEFALTVTTIWNGVKYMYTILLIILVLLLIGALPTWPYSTAWGYYPSGGLGLVLIIVLVLVLMGRV
jgi:hypothetical protein